MPDRVRAHAAVFRALGDLTRLRLLKLLVQAGEPVCVCELADALGVPQYHVSRHLAVLRAVGLVTDDRTGTWVQYAPAAGASGLIAALYRVVQQEVNGAVFRRDWKRLQVRLALREAGRCVFGPGAPEVEASFVQAGLGEIQANGS